MVVAIVLIMFVAIAGVVAYYYTTQVNTTKTKIAVAFDWVIYGKFAMFYPAIQKGWYSDAGLDVTFLPGRGSADNVKRLVSGEVQFAFVDGLHTVMANSLGVNLTALGVYHDKNPVGIFSRADAGIKKPSDLEGKTIYTAIGGDENRYVRLQLKGWNVNATVTEVDFNTQVNGFIQGTFKTICTYSTVMAGVWYKGIQTDNIQLDPYFDIYNECFVARTEWINANPNTVAKFINATYAGVKWSIAHQDEALNIYMQMNGFTDADRPLQQAQFKVGIDLFNSTTAQQHQYGYMTFDKWQRTERFCVDTRLIDAPMTNGQINALFTNEYLPSS